MFFDWIKVEQEFPNHEMPIVAKRGYRGIDLDTGEDGGINQSPVQHKGSYSTSIKITIRGSKLIFDGNISRWGRADNLFGYSTLDQCMDSINALLKTIHPDLPLFTKFPKFDKGSDILSLNRQAGENEKAGLIPQGAVFKRLDITSNRAVGEGAVLDYIKAVSTQRYRNSIPRLHTNCRTCDWLSPKGNATEIYPSVYDKAFELELHTEPKIKRQYGEESAEYKYLRKVIDYCKSNGVARFEQKLHSQFLARHNLNHWGLFDDAQFHSSSGPVLPPLKKLQTQFTDIDSRLQVEAMTLENISQQLISNGIVSSTKAANTTSMYAIEWMTGQSFDLSKSQVKTHRARLRKIGIDIATPCDISRFSPVKVVRAKKIEVQTLAMPSWYQKPAVSHLRLVA